MNERLAYSAEEAARLLGISERNLRARIARGEVRVVRLGRRVLLPAEVLRDLLSERPAQGTTR